MKTAIFSDWKSSEESGFVYGVPEGCVVRNTFLEWQDTGAGAVFPADEVTETHSKVASTRQRRSQSCPAETSTHIPDMDTCNGSESLDSTRSPTTEDGREREDMEGGITAESPQSQSALPWQPYPEQDEGNWKSQSAWSPTSQNGRNKGRALASPTSLVLRGLPFNVTGPEIFKFVGQAGVSRDDLAPEGGVVLLTNVQGRPSGFAEVHLAAGADFWDVRQKLHMQRLGGRYVEALPPRPTRKPGGGSKSGGRDRDQRNVWKRT